MLPIHGSGEDVRNEFVRPVDDEDYAALAG